MSAGQSRTPASLATSTLGGVSGYFAAGLITIVGLTSANLGLVGNANLLRLDALGLGLLSLLAAIQLRRSRASSGLLALSVGLIAFAVLDEVAAKLSPG